MAAGSRLRELRSQSQAAARAGMAWEPLAATRPAGGNSAGVRRHGHMGRDQLLDSRALIQPERDLQYFQYSHTRPLIQPPLVSSASIPLSGPQEGGAPPHAPRTAPRTASAPAPRNRTALCVLTHN
jgi:hypothetical protein